MTVEWVAHLLWAVYQGLEVHGGNKWLLRVPHFVTLAGKSLGHETNFVHACMHAKICVSSFHKH